MVGTGVAVAAISDKGCFTHTHSVNSQAQYLELLLVARKVLTGGERVQKGCHISDQQKEA